MLDHLRATGDELPPALAFHLGVELLKQRPRSLEDVELNLEDGSVVIRHEQTEAPTALIRELLPGKLTPGVLEEHLAAENITAEDLERVIEERFLRSGPEELAEYLQALSLPSDLPERSTRSYEYRRRRSLRAGLVVSFTVAVILGIVVIWRLLL